MGAPVFRRVLLKLSGEALMGGLEFGTDPDRLRAVAAEMRAGGAYAHSALMLDALNTEPAKT